jgi:hypothetical protein
MAGTAVGASRTILGEEEVRTPLVDIYLGLEAHRTLRGESWPTNLGSVVSRIFGGISPPVRSGIICSFFTVDQKTIKVTNTCHRRGWVPS